jgi:hypothetical protein
MSVQMVQQPCSQAHTLGLGRVVIAAQLQTVMLRASPLQFTKPEERFTVISEKLAASRAVFHALTAP